MGIYEWEDCPHCGKCISDVRREIASETTISQEFEHYPHCGGIFKTGKSEWSEKDELEKAGSIIRIVRWAFLRQRNLYRKKSKNYRNTLIYSGTITGGIPNPFEYELVACLP